MKNCSSIRFVSRVARRAGWPVAWRTVGKLGVTARRVRYRIIGDIDDHPDVLIVCVGSNDMLAGRSVREWAADITPVLDLIHCVRDHKATTAK